MLTPLAARAVTADQDSFTKEQITVGSTPRTYDLYVPASYSAANAVHAVALVFHGLYSTSSSLEKYVLPAASAHGLVVAFPDGLGNSWNAGSCCGSAKQAGIDDVAFAGALAKSLTARFHPRTVVAAGFSNGAMLSWRLACQRGSIVSGIVDAGGTEALPEPACTPTRRILEVSVHGRRDPVVPFQGGASLTTQAETASPGFRAIPDVITEWGKDHEQCRSLVSTHLPGWESTHWGNCPNGSSITLYAIDGMAHDVPNYQQGYPVDFGTLIVDTAARAR